MILDASYTQKIRFGNDRQLSQKKRHAKEGSDIFARSLGLRVVRMSTVRERPELFDRIGL